MPNEKKSTTNNKNNTQKDSPREQNSEAKPTEVIDETELNIDISSLNFPSKDDLYLDDVITDTLDKEIVMVVTSNSKVQTGNNHKVYSTTVVEKGSVGKKLNHKYNEGVKRFKTFLNYPLEGFGRRFSMWVVILMGITVIVSGLFVAIMGELWATSPSLEQFMKRPIESSVVYARDGKTKIYEYYKEERRELVSISKIPKVMQLAAIALEDENFYRNEQGIPWKNIMGAMQKCITSGGESCRGGSGLAQQLVKVMTKNQEFSTDRKIRELISAIKLNQDSNHTDILEAYLNWVSFGRNSYGIEQASKSYYGKSISEKDSSGNFTLNPTEACFLASLVQSPGYYPTGIGKPDSQAYKDLAYRKNFCLNKLSDLDLPIDNNGTLGKYISSKDDLKKWKEMDSILVDYKDAPAQRQSNKIVFIHPRTDNPFPHFRDYVTDELTKIYGKDMVYNGGLKIITTIDPDVQNKAQEIVSKAEAKLNYVGATNAGGLILDGPTGEILAMVGSVDYNREDIDGQVNMTTAPRQPGSSIKPYVYANAWSNGYNPATKIVDKSETWAGYSPKNFSGKFNGNVTMRYALQNSLNIPAVKALFLGGNSSAGITDYSLNPNSLVEKKMNEFFGFTNRLGLNFPCIPSGDGQDVCNDPQQAKNAYRRRCYLSTALGGCEVKMIDHATGINTLLHEGNLRTATPFLSITVKDGDSEVEIYKNKKDQAFYPKQDEVIDPVIARQTANVMTDYETRAAEYGTLRYQLELKDKNWRVAAKTGTSNGPKDFWLVGGSPLYTVTIWAGRNDNGNMSADTSAGVSSAFMWNQLMEMAHTGKPVTNFSTQGLEKVDVGNGKTELLTPMQKVYLRERGGVVEPRYN
jgi:membrane peptidoglycan carboxypeptidase